MALDPIADVLRAHDAGLVLLSGPLDCPGHVLLPWFAHAALRGDTGAAPPALVVLAAAFPPSAHAAALRKAQQQQQPPQQPQHQAPLPVLYVEPRFPGPDDDEDEEWEASEAARSAGGVGGGGGGGGGGGWLRRLSADLAAAVRRQAQAQQAAASAPGGGRQPGATAAATTAAAAATTTTPPARAAPPQITVLVDSLTVLAAAADAGADADAAPSTATATAPSVFRAPRPSARQLDWLAFLHSLASLEAQAPRARVRVVALCADDVPADAAWRRGLRHRCSAALALSPVEGRTAGLDGELRAEARAAPAKGTKDEAGAVVFAPGAQAALAAAGSGGGGGGGWAGGGEGWAGGRCFFRASELSVRWLSDVQSADLMR